jgi:hypothetical protein
MDGDSDNSHGTGIIAAVVAVLSTTSKYEQRDLEKKRAQEAKLA